MKKWIITEGDFGTCNGEKYLEYMCPVCGPEKHNWIQSTKGSEKILMCHVCGFREGWDVEENLQTIEESVAKIRAVLKC
jgi:transcription elongation factor Elf1